MATFGLINLGVLPLLLEAMAPAYAQQAQQAQQDHREQETRRPQQEQDAKPAHQESRPRPEHQDQLPKHERSQPERSPQPVRPDRPARPEQPRPQEPRPDRPPPVVRPIPTSPPKRPTEQPKRPTDIPTRPPEAKPVVRPRPPTQDPHGQARPPQERPPQHPPQAQPIAAPPPVAHGNLAQHSELWPSRRARNWETEHRSWQQRGGYTGYHLPTARYQNSFGPNHGFRMFSYQLQMMGGYPRFQYGGMWISVMDPWPEYWSNDWYGTDDLYIEFFGGGYYLRNRRHPGDRIAIAILVN